MLRPPPLLGFLAMLLLCGSCASAVSLESDAREQFEQGNYTVAAQLYRDLLRLKPEDPPTIQALAASLFADGQFPELVSLSPALSYPAPPTSLLAEAAQRMGLSPAELTTPRLSQDDLPYLRRTALYHELASRLTSQISSPDEKLHALFDWTIRNIQSAPAPSHPELPAWPAQVMLRGYGACDRSAWVFVSLARQLGFRAYLVVLWDPVAETSPHALAGVLRNDKLVLFDTFFGIPMTLPTGEPAGLDDVIDDSRVLASLREVFPNYPAQLTHFQNAIITIAAEPQAITARARFLQSALDNLDPPARAYMNLDAELAALAETLYGKTPPTDLKLRFTDTRRPYVIDLWGYPFNLERELATSRAQQESAEAYSYLIPLIRARDAQISGNLETALRAYSSLLSAGLLPPTAAADATYFRALAMYDVGLYEAAAEEFRSYLESHPDGPWVESAGYNMGRALETSHRPEEAIQAYRALRDTPKAASAMFRIRDLERELGDKVVNP